MRGIKTETGRIYRILRVHRFKAAFSVILFLSCVGPGYAEDIGVGGSATDGTTPLALAPGAPAGSYALSGFESVNPYNGGLNFHLPLLQVGGRGSARMTVTLAIEQKWRVEDLAIPQPDGSFKHVYMAEPNWWEGLKPGYGPGVLQGRYAIWGDQTCPDATTLASKTLTRLTFTAPDGTEYELHDQATGGAPAKINCGEPAPSRGRVFVSADGTAATFIADAPITDVIISPPGDTQLYPAGYLILRDGTRYRVNGPHPFEWVRDRNGNKLTFTYDGNGRVINIADSLNRQVNICYAQTVGGDCQGNPFDEITFSGFGGATRTLRVEYALLAAVLRPNSNYAVQDYTNLFPELNAASGTRYNPTVISSVELPNGQRYQFYYNPYGELARVELPTGGAMEYDYAAGVEGAPASGVWGGTQIFRRVVERRLYPNGGFGSGFEGRTTFSRPETESPTAGYSNAGYVEVKHWDAAGQLEAEERHYYFGTPAFSLLHQEPLDYVVWRDGKEYQTEEGPSVLRRVNDTWEQQPPAWWTEDAATAPLNNPRLTDTLTTLVETSRVSRQHFEYDLYNNKTVTEEYDYGQGSFGPLVRRTETGFLASDYDTVKPDTANPDPSLTTHIRNLPSLQTVKDGSGNAVAQTNYEYDHYNSDGTHAPLLPRAGITGIDATFSSNARGNVTAVTRWLNTGGSVISYSQYDIAGNVVQKIDPLGNVTQIDYSSTFQYAYPTMVISPVPDPSGVHGSSSPLITHTDYDFSTGKVTSTTDANGQQTKYCYLVGTDAGCTTGNPEPLDRLTGVISPQVLVNQAPYNPMTLFTYHDSQLNVETARDLNSTGDGAIHTKAVYDGLGRVIQTQMLSDPQGIVYTDTTYDGLGRKHTVSNPYRSTSDDTYGITTFGYDSLSRIKTIETTDRFGASTGVVRTDYYGNATTVTDQAGKARKSITDSAGRLAQVIEDPSGLAYQTNYGYDALDDLKTVLQGGQTRSFSYDSLKRLTSATNPENGTVNYTSYDGNGNLLSKTDARGITTTFHYDGLNRVYQKSYSDVTPGVTYSYDTGTNGKGHLTQVTSSVSTMNYGPFDAMGRVTASSQVTDTQTYPFSYGYNLAGGMTSETYPSLRTVTTSFDAAGRASSVSGSGNETYVSTISYAAHGAMQTMALGNGLTETLSYNSRLQPLSIGVGSLVSFGYDYGTTNNNGNVLSQTITAPGFNVTQTYSYNDPMNRLSGISESSGWNQTYGYDRYGNRNAGTSTSPYMPLLVPTISQTNNRITAANYAYDNAGNLTQWPAAPGSSVYDAENKMISFNGGAATYGYDGEGRRVKKTVQSPSTTTIFVYNVLGQLVAEYCSGSGCLSSSGTEFLTADHLGSTRVVTDAAGAVVARHDYLPFGEEISSGIGGRTTAMGYGEDDGIRQKFTSKERDAETGLDYFLARYYSGAQGRFTIVDPVIITPERLRDPQQLNRYVYVRNNPLRLVDPTGEILTLAGNIDAGSDDLCQIAGGDICSRITVNDNGTVSFDTKDLDLSTNEGARLINELVTSTENYAYTVSESENTAAGPQAMGRRVESNLDNRPDYRYGKGKPANAFPPNGVDDQVTVNPKGQYADTQGRPVPEFAVAFHELAEAYAKVDQGKHYNDSLIVINGAVLAGVSERGAHSDAVLRELKLRDQRPSLRSTGRAGDEVHQIIRDPH